jgi:hypothetical protein
LLQQQPVRATTRVAQKLSRKRKETGPRPPPSRRPVFSEMAGNPVFGVTSGHTGYGHRCWSVSVVAAASVVVAARARTRRKPR